MTLHTVEVKFTKSPKNVPWTKTFENAEFAASCANFWMKNPAVASVLVSSKEF